MQADPYRVVEVEQTSEGEGETWGKVKFAGATGRLTLETRRTELLTFFVPGQFFSIDMRFTPESPQGAPMDFDSLVQVSPRPTKRRDSRHVSGKNGEHVLYEKHDVDAPPNIKDRNGDITLGLCKLCGAGEADLLDPCTGAKRAKADDSWERAFGMLIAACMPADKVIANTATVGDTINWFKERVETAYRLERVTTAAQQVAAGVLTHAVPTPVAWMYVSASGVPNTPYASEKRCRRDANMFGGSVRPLIFGDHAPPAVPVESLGRDAEPQPPKPAGDQLPEDNGVEYADGPWAAGWEERIGPPKPAGAVPLPEPEWLTLLRKELFLAAMKSNFTLTRDELQHLINLGDAREAAGRAVAEGYCLMPMKGTPEIFTAMRMSVGDGVAMGPVYYAALSAGAIATPIPQQPAAEGGTCSRRCSETLECDGSCAPAAVNKQMTTPAEGAGREAVAWMHDDGDRVIHARTKAVALRDGGASASSVAAYSVPLYARPTPAADAGKAIDPVPLNAVRAAVDAIRTGRLANAIENLRVLEIYLRALAPERRYSPHTEDFINRTNADYATWCAVTYAPESLDENGFMSLHGLWAWQEQERRIDALRVSLQSAPQPIEMVLHCPRCHVQHIDAPKPCNLGVGCGEHGVCYADAHGEPERCGAWTNPPHRSHLCASCGFVWRPADVPTTGVAEIKTRGQNDSDPTAEKTLSAREYAIQVLGFTEAELDRITGEVSAEARTGDRK